MMFRFRKSIRVLMILLLVIIITLYYSSTQMQLMNPESVTLYFKMIYKKYTDTDLKLDSNPTFQANLHDITLEKLNDPSVSTFYFLQPGYVPPTQVSVPEYFISGSPSEESKPVVQPFDPRFTISVYLNWIRENPNKSVPFHWSDWIDFMILNKFILLPEKKKETCYHLFYLHDKQFQDGDSRMEVRDYCQEDPEHPLGFRISRFPKSQERENTRLLGKSFLYSTFPSPTSLIFLTNSKGSYKVDVLNEKNELNMSLLHNGMVESVVKSEQSRDLDVLESYKALLKARKPSLPQSPSDLLVELDESWFEVDAEQTIKQLEKKGKDLTYMQRRYADALDFSLHNTSPEKSFNEAKFLNSDKSKAFGDHYDWRFYNGLTVGTDAQVIALHRILKNYLQFCRSNGLVTWIAHGSLLSWYWNGMAFPWDADTDVQMPIRDLHRLAENFNQSLVIENIGHDKEDVDIKDAEFSGMGSFFIDVGNSITHRDYGNGNNNIDARFIDIQTGLYVDITGLSVSKQPAPDRYNHLLPDPSEDMDTKSANKKKKIYNCRNRHFSSLDELSPLVKTVVQNEVGYVPLNFGPMLNNEYSIEGLLSNVYKGYYYLNSFRVWVQSHTILEYLQDKTSWVEKQRGIQSAKRDLTIEEEESLGELTVEDHGNLIYNSWLLREYLVSKDSTKFHEQQMRRLLKNSMHNYYDELVNYLDGPNVNKAIWGDLFMHEIFVHNWDYQNEVNKLKELAQMYEDTAE